MSNEPDFLTIDEVAERLRLSRDSVYRFAARGQLPGRKIGRVWRFSRDAIDQYMLLQQEVGQRKRVEKKLEAADERYRDLYDHAPDMFATVDVESRTIQQCNETLAEYLGIPRAKLIGRPIDEIHDAECVGKLWHALDVFKRVGEVRDVELQIKGASGRTIDVSLNVSSVRDDAENVIAGRAIWRDITDRKIAERALQQSHDNLEQSVQARTVELVESLRRLKEQEGRYRSVFETAGVAIICLDRDHLVLEWNEEAERIFGYGKRDAVGGNYLELCVPAGARADVAEDIERVLGGRNTRGFENAVIDKEGSERFVRWNVTRLVDSEDRPIGIVACGEDITDRRKADLALAVSEQRFRELAETIPGVFWMTSADFSRVLYVSPKYEGVWGRSADSLYANAEAWIEAILPEDRDRVHDEFAKIISEGSFDAEYRIRRPDGSVRWIRDRGAPVLDESGRALRLVGHAEDISDRREAELALERSRGKP